MFFGAGGLLLALRPNLPALLSFEVAHASMLAGLMGQAMAMRQEGLPRLRQGSSVFLLCVVLPLLSAAIFAWVRRLEVVWGVAYFASAVGVGALTVVLTSVRVWHTGRQHVERFEFQAVAAAESATAMTPPPRQTSPSYSTAD